MLKLISSAARRRYEAEDAISRLLAPLRKIEIIGSPTPGQPGAQVYRCYSWCGTLLYIGSTFNVKRRLAQHGYYIVDWRRPASPWFPLVARVVSENYLTRDEAFAAERLAIDMECPIMQRDGKPADGDWVRGLA